MEECARSAKGGDGGAASSRQDSISRRTMQVSARTIDRHAITRQFAWTIATQSRQTAMRGVFLVAAELSAHGLIVSSNGANRGTLGCWRYR